MGVFAGSFGANPVAGEFAIEGELRIARPLAEHEELAFALGKRGDTGQLA